MPNSLVDRIERMTTHGRLRYNPNGEPFPTYTCTCCGTPIDLDYEQGERDMNNRLSAFLSQHERCEIPQKEHHGK